MPELPEAETIKRVIEPQIQGLMIKNVIVNRPEVIAYPHAGEFCQQLVGQTIIRHSTSGKISADFAGQRRPRDYHTCE